MVKIAFAPRGFCKPQQELRQLEGKLLAFNPLHFDGRISSDGAPRNPESRSEKE
jgi:hypothetical protein